MNVLFPVVNSQHMIEKPLQSDFNPFSLGSIPKSFATNCGKSICNTLVTADTLDSQKSDVMDESQSRKSLTQITQCNFTPIKSCSNQTLVQDFKTEISKISITPTDYFGSWRPHQKFHDINSQMNEVFEENLELFEATLHKLVRSSNEYLEEDYDTNPNPCKVKKFFELPKEFGMSDSNHSQRRKINKMIKNTSKKITKKNIKKNKKVNKNLKNSDDRSTQSILKTIEEAKSIISSTSKPRSSLIKCDDLFNHSAIFGDRNSQTIKDRFAELNVQDQRLKEQEHELCSSPDWWLHSPGQLDCGTSSGAESHTNLMMRDDFLNEGEWLSKPNYYGIDDDVNSI